MDSKKYDGCEDEVSVSDLVVAIVRLEYELSEQGYALEYGEGNYDSHDFHLYTDAKIRAMTVTVASIYNAQEQHAITDEFVSYCYELLTTSQFIGAAARLCNKNEKE